MSQQAYTNFDIMFERLNFYMSIAGVDLRVRDDYPLTRLSMLWIGFLGIVTASFLYTVCVADPAAVWRTCCISPIVLQGLIKYYVGLTNARLFAETLGRLRRIYALNRRNESTEQALVLRVWSQRMLFVVRHGWLPITATVLTMCALPVLTYVRLGQLELLLELWLPLVSQTEPIGYALHTAFHVACMVLAVAGTCATDLLMIMLTMHVFPMGGIWRCMWRQMDEALAQQQPGGAQRLSPGGRQRGAFFRVMLDVHRDISAFMRCMSEIYYPVTCVEVFSDSCMLCINLYAFLVLEWRQAPVIGGLILMKLLMFCLMGTLVEVAADRVYATLLQTRWYGLPVEEKRILVAVLSDAQRPGVLMAGTVQLNMVTFVEAVKTVWSVGMLLVQE